MRPYTAYAILETTRKGKKQLAIFDARLPIFWRRQIAADVNRDRCNGSGEIVQVTIRKREKKKAAKAALKKAS